MMRNLLQAAGWTLVLVFAGHLCAADVNYFPLETGNRWVYRASAPGLARSFTITVGLPALIDGRTYYFVSGYASQRVLMRRDADGNLYVRSQETDRDLLLTAFDPAFGSYPSPLREECAHVARPEESMVPYAPGRGADPLLAREIRYRCSCVGTGIESELYVNHVGMVRRVGISIGGPVAFELVYARAGRLTYEPETMVAFRVALPSSTVERADPQERPLLKGSLRVSSNGQPVTLDYPTMQTYDLQLRDSRGNVLATWSAGRLFGQASRQIRGQEISFDFEMPLADQAGKALADGDYVLEAWLPAEPGRPFAAQVPVTLSTRR
jgi:hypothetical protein